MERASGHDPSIHSVHWVSLFTISRRDSIKQIRINKEKNMNLLQKHMCEKFVNVIFFRMDMDWFKVSTKFLTITSPCQIFFGKSYKNKQQKATRKLNTFYILDLLIQLICEKVQLKAKFAHYLGWKYVYKWTGN